MDRKCQQCMAQIILEIGQDSLRQYLFQNVLHPSIRSHQKSTLSNYNTSNLLLNPPMGRFLFVSKRVNLRKQRAPRRRRRCHVRSPGSHLGVLCVCRGRHVGSFIPRGVGTSTPFCYSSSRCHKMAAGAFPQWLPFGRTRYGEAESASFQIPYQWLLQRWHCSQLPHMTLQINNGFRI